MGKNEERKVRGGERNNFSKATITPKSHKTAHKNNS
jgi:hypothetical protein